MSIARLAVVVLAGVACLLFVPDRAAAAAIPSARCNGGGCDGWFRTGVTVTWDIDPAGATATSGCDPAGVSDDTAAATFTCTVSYGTGGVFNSVTVRKDASPPDVTASIARGPDASGWYTTPVAVFFKGEDGASGVASCTGDGTYGGPDGGAISLGGSCTDNAGNTRSASLTIKYDSTPPTVAGVPARPPDVAGWYNHPVEIGWKGEDTASGVTECSPAVTYKGPDASPAKLVGQCRDGAGLLSAPTTVELRYDSTPTAKPRLKLRHRGDAISLAWVTAPDVVRTRIERAPGLKTKKSAVVFDGKARSFVDRRIRDGVRYWYEVTLFDQAGNRAVETVGLRPAAGIFAPAEGAVVRKPPLMTWSPATGASFYNVQLWRGKTKLLTTWVKVPKLALPRRWTFGGKARTLVDGPYKAYVWPALGTPKKPRYGKLLGQVGFVVKRR